MPLSTLPLMEEMRDGDPVAGSMHCMIVALSKQRGQGG